MTLDTAQAPTSEQATRTGTIIAVAWSAELMNGIAKEQHDSAEVRQWGIPGDRHYGETRYSTSQRKTLPNNRTITVLAVEATRAACEAIGIPTDTIPPGGTGENFLTEGLGDLGDYSQGDEVLILDSERNPKVILRIEGQNDPCVSLQVYHKLMTKNMMHRRGLLCTVLKEGTVNVGDTVTIIRTS